MAIYWAMEVLAALLNSVLPMFGHVWLTFVGYDDAAAQGVEWEGGWRLESPFCGCREKALSND